MTIDKIGGINNIQSTNSVKKTNNVNKTASDSVDISRDAKISAQNEYLLNIIKEAPEVRTEKVKDGIELLKQYEKDPTLEKKAIDAIAQKLTDNLFNSEEEL